MEKRPYTIMVASQKGGVGKTTVAVNLAVALAKHDYKVILIDADASTFSVNGHLGIRASGNGFIEAVQGKSSINDSIFVYQPLDLHLMLGSESKEIYRPDAEDLSKFYAQIAKTDYDFVVIDSSPGLFDSTYAKYINDVIIVTTPDNPSATSNAKLAAFCAKLKLSYRLVINKSGNSKSALEKEDVERLFGDVAFGTLPEDGLVGQSILKQVPACLMDNGAPFPASIEELSRVYLLKAGEPSRKDPDRFARRSFFRKFADWTIGPKYKN